MEHFNFSSDRIVMTRPRDDDAIWMLSDNSATNTANNNSFINAAHKIIRSAFITNLNCKHSSQTTEGTKCWCSKCAKERLRNKPKTDLLFLSSDLLFDYLRQYEVIEWRSQRLCNGYLPSFETIG